MLANKVQRNDIKTRSKFQTPASDIHMNRADEALKAGGKPIKVIYYKDTNFQMMDF
jgi:hypothetical protein